MSTRRSFLATASVLAAVLPTMGDVARAATPKPGSNTSKLAFRFDREAFDEVLLKPAMHKQCFGAVRLAGGSVVGFMASSILAYDDDLGEGNGAMQAVGVLYHSSAILLAMSDGVWNDILIPYLRRDERWRGEVPEAKPGKGNPYLKPIWVPGLINLRGAALFVCNKAIEGFAYGAASALKESPKRVYAAILAGIVPGAVVVPSGVMAINACQEARFTYIQTSL